MRRTDVMAFGGSGLDRAPALRADPEALALAPGTLMLPFWRGRPLVSGEGEATDLAWLPAAHPLVAGLADPVLLGLDDGRPRMAVDVSASLTGAPAASAFDATRTPHPDLPQDQAFADLRAVMSALSPRAAELAATGRALLEWHRTHGFCACCGERSTMTQAGWQRQCPVCKAPHFPRTDPVVIMLITRGNRVLLGRSPGWPEGMYSLLAGFVEPGETVEAAVRREVAEETGIPVGPVRYVASQPWPFPANLMLGCAGEALDDRITLDPAELEDALWLSREDLLAVAAGLHPSIRPSRRGSIAHFILMEWLADRLH
jgi:NAD+ diphosphatase